VVEHRSGHGSKFTSKYNVTKLVYYEIYDSIIDAIAREKAIKAGSRAKKVALINKMNPAWNDLTVSVARSAKSNLAPRHCEEDDRAAGLGTDEATPSVR
jgi:predicted GIY-YIG superfamily endonuclease